MEFLNDKNKLYAIGQFYFEAARDEFNRPVSQFKGVVAGFIIKKEDGTEFQVRADKELPLAKIPFAKRDLDNLEVGSKVQSVVDGQRFTVIKVFPVYGDIWVKDDNGKTEAKKYIDLRRAI